MAESAVRDPLPPVLHHSTINLLCGASGVGKTAFIAGLARQFRDGDPIFGYRPNPLPGIGYLGVDRKWARDSAWWFEKAGFPEIAHYSFKEDPTFNLSRITAPKTGNLADIFAEHLDKLGLPNGSLVFVDPIALYMGGDMNHYPKVSQACMYLQRIVMARQFCIIGTDHTSKQKADTGQRYLRPQDRINGSMAKLGFTDTQMALSAPEEIEDSNGCHTFHWNPHHAKAGTFRVRQQATGLFLAEDASHQAIPATPDSPLTPSQEALLVLIPAFPETISTAELIRLFQDTGSRPTLHRHLAVLQAKGLVYAFGHGIWTRGTDPHPTDPLPTPPKK